MRGCFVAVPDSKCGTGSICVFIIIHVVFNTFLSGGAGVIFRTFVLKVIVIIKTRHAYSVLFSTYSFSFSTYSFWFSSYSVLSNLIRILFILIRILFILILYHFVSLCLIISYRESFCVIFDKISLIWRYSAFFQSDSVPFGFRTHSFFALRARPNESENRMALNQTEKCRITSNKIDYVKITQNNTQEDMIRHNDTKWYRIRLNKTE